ncbi:hypothetical protein EVG20_g9732, partial [Dentipellis fragilis]
MRLTKVADVEAQKETFTSHAHAHVAGVHSPGFPRSLSIHETVEPSSRLPVEYRTLSIHVNTKASSGDDSEKEAVKDLINLDWHKITSDEALRRLGVSPKTGLDSTQAQRRIATHGKNQLSPPPSHTLRRVLGWIFGGFGTLLLAASIVCFIAWKPLGNPNPQASNLALAVVLLVVIVVQAIFNAWQDFSTSRVMASIKNMLPSDVLVLRDSAQVSLGAAELVPGDLVYIVLGQKVPADVRLIEVSGDLKFDRSVLTGESEPVSGRIDMTDENILETKNIGLQGTLCVNGSGLGLVIQTGDQTIFGKIAKLSSATSTHLTTLQREILRFVIIIASLATFVAIVIVILWAAWLRRSFPDYINVSGLLIDIVSVMVAFIPEGLPIAVTISLAKVAHTLSKHKVLCKSLSIVETLGSVNVLCSDKTGTLTQNKMHVEDAAVYDTSFVTSSLQETLKSAPKEVRENMRQLPAISAICNAATFQAEGHVIGDATDSAILRFADSFHPVDEVRDDWMTVFKMNFNSKTKFMLMLSELSASRKRSRSDDPIAPLASWDDFGTDDFLLTVKGAPEILFPRCSYVLDPSGGPSIPLSVAIRDRIIAVQEKWASQGRRVLLLARRTIPRQEFPKTIERFSDAFEELVGEFNADLCIVGLVGLIDPLKPDIPDTVRTCRGAGIRFFVVTGDHPATSVAIAAQAGIITDVSTVHKSSNLSTKSSPAPATPADTCDPDPPRQSYSQSQSIVLTGAELDALSPTQLDVLCGYTEIVFARTTPGAEAAHRAGVP